MTKKEELIDYIETSLGIELRTIYITSKQIDQIITEAIEYFEQHSSMSVQEFFLLVQVTPGTANYVMPLRTRSVLNIIATNNPLDIFSIERHIVDNSIFNSAYRNTAGYNLLDIYLTRSWIQTARKMLVKEHSFNFSELDQTLRLDHAPSDAASVIVQGYNYIFDSTDDENGVFLYPWIKQYVLALCWIRVGTNLKIYGNVPLPAGMTFDADFALDMGKTLKDELKVELEQVYNEPADFIVG